MTFRPLHINNQEWKYFVGKRNVVIKHPGPKVKKSIVPIKLIIGRDPSDFDEDQQIPVEPSDVKNFIQNVVIAHSVGVVSED